MSTNDLETKPPQLAPQGSDGSGVVAALMPALEEYASRLSSSRNSTPTSSPARANLRPLSRGGSRPPVGPSQSKKRKIHDEDSVKIPANQFDNKKLFSEKDSVFDDVKLTYVLPENCFENTMYLDEVKKDEATFKHIGFGAFASKIQLVLAEDTDHKSYAGEEYARSQQQWVEQVRSQMFQRPRLSAILACGTKRDVDKTVGDNAKTWAQKLKSGMASKNTNEQEVLEARAEYRTKQLALQQAQQEFSFIEKELLVKTSTLTQKEVEIVQTCRHLEMARGFEILLTDLEGTKMENRMFGWAPGGSQEAMLDIGAIMDVLELKNPEDDTMVAHQSLCDLAERENSGELARINTILKKQGYETHVYFLNLWKLVPEGYTKEEWVTFNGDSPNFRTSHVSAQLYCSRLLRYLGLPPSDWIAPPQATVAATNVDCDGYKDGDGDDDVDPKQGFCDGLQYLAGMITTMNPKDRKDAIETLQLTVAQLQNIAANDGETDGETDGDKTGGH